MTLVLEIQWSIESTKVSVFDTATQTDVGEGRSAHPEPVNHQTDPTHWWSALVDATRHAVDGAAAMGITDAEIRTVMLDVAPAPGGIVILDSSGNAVGPALLGSHEASASDAAWLVSRVDGGADAWLAATGVLPGAGSTAALLSFVHRTEPSTWDRAESFTIPTGWIAEQLGAKSAVSIHDATGTAVLDRSDTSRWCSELLPIIDPNRDWNACLPRTADAATPVGRMSPAASTQLGIAPGLPIHLGSSIAR
jgi:xylulokinase